ncbi:hypothetical protein PSAR109036_08210 [Psychrobacter arenosus]|jgi:hypothetical protein|uniref:hypothetical protein n=1 Tax=Psychrobacter arenosus TaxID=256326 RepID=UPI0019190F1F|nr:hypothetical protein [Psychrobacter arenosus]
MKKSLEEIKSNRADWEAIAYAFYSLAHNDFSIWDNLSYDLKDSEVGTICQKYIDTKDYKYVREAGQMLAGEHWFTALGRTF